MSLFKKKAEPVVLEAKSKVTETLRFTLDHPRGEVTLHHPGNNWTFEDKWLLVSHTDSPGSLVMYLYSNIVSTIKHQVTQHPPELTESDKKVLAEKLV